ncbi:MAG: CNNM domain-containing protein [Phycisphaerales bacterium]
MSTLELIAWVGVVLLAIAGSAWCAGFETGMYCVNRVRLNLRVARGERRAVLLRREIDHPNRALATLLISNTAFGNLLSVGITSLLSTRDLGDAWLLAVNLLIVVPTLVVLGEALPKEIFRVEADRLNYWTAPLLVWLRRLLTLVGLIPLVDAVASIAMRWARANEPGSLSTPRHAIAALLKEGARHGILSEAQTNMVDRALLLRDTLVRGEMVPWSRVRTIPLNGKRRQLAGGLARQSFSAYPVVGPQGDVLGVVSHLDLCLRHDTPLDQLMHPPVLLAPDMRVRDALLAIRRAGMLIGVVVADGKPAGIVTPKDLIEPLLTADPGIVRS